MMDELHGILTSQNYPFHLVDGITVSRSLTKYEGFRLARDVLYGVVDRKTVLYLSGGRTPEDLYENLAKDRRLSSGALALIDERYGQRWHNTSNEKMIEGSGLLAYTNSLEVPFYPILQDPQQDLADTAKNYDMTVSYLFAGFPRSVGILGVGVDGHTAGIAGNRQDPALVSGDLFENPLFQDDEKLRLVSSFSDLSGPFKERVTMTFTGLALINIYIVLVFGEDKGDALKKMFEDGSEEDVPSRFFRRPEVARRTLLITDQKV
jgi:6-phosphogluconolactonase/glucosamine-6-phosphate isomerase/deaminase